jgi:hypothetical protein
VGGPNLHGTELELFHFLRVTGNLAGGVMATEKECIEYARECVRLAGLANEPDIRERLLDIAREWMAAAMREDVPMEAAPSISVSENKGTKSRPCA